MSRVRCSDTAERASASWLRRVRQFHDALHVEDRPEGLSARPPALPDPRDYLPRDPRPGRLRPVSSPVGTALRPSWEELPGSLRDGLADRLGAITTAWMQAGGFTPGLAARLLPATALPCSRRAGHHRGATPDRSTSSPAAVRTRR